MKKQLTKLKENKLALAKAEFKQFRKKQQESKQVKRSAPPAPVATSFAPKAAHKILSCSKYPGKISRVDYELTETVATAIKATAIKPSKATPGAIQTPNLDSVLLKRKIERSSSYQGCPHCGKENICYCSYCGEISCSTQSGQRHTCPTCNKTYRTVPLTDAIDLTANRERPTTENMTNTKTKPLPRRTKTALPKTSTKSLPQHPRGLLPKK